MADFGEFMPIAAEKPVEWRQVELDVQLLLISISTLPERMMRPLLTIPDAAPMFRAA